MSWVPGAHQDQGRPKGSKSADKGAYKSPTKEVLPSAAGVEPTTLWV